jgi:hypothetical protein
MRSPSLRRKADRYARSVFVALPFVWFLAGCAPEPIAPCAEFSADAVCGFAKPEDIVSIPGSVQLLVIEHGGETSPAGFSLLDTRALRRTMLPVENEPLDGVGDSACPGPPGKLAPGGIDLVTLGDSAFRVLAINRASPARVEFYTLKRSGETARLTWNGCVPVTPGLFLNDVAALPDGAFAATHMVDPGAAGSALAPLRFFFGVDTGYIVRWSGADGWRKIPNSDGSFPNGIAASSDGRTSDGAAIYFAETFGEAVNRLDVNTGERQRRKLGFQPDNLTWTEDGALLAVGHDGLPLLTTRGCRDLGRSGCGFSFRVARLSRDLASIEILFRSDGKSIPGASTALLQDEALWLGTAFGDRVTRVSVSPPNAQTPPVSR